ncbi:MAG: hypothetical protein JST08_03440 [Actinobacteria bacterium]|nr:hypothetical protein [Actinomycetota bacterium]
MYRTRLLAMAIGTVLALAACGGSSSDGGTTAAKPTGDGATVRAPGDPEPGGERKPDTHASSSSPTAGKGADGCQARLDNFVSRMADLRQSLVAGLSYDEYVIRVRAIRDAYEAVPVDKLGAACVTGPAAAAEDAFNQYLRAANAWGDCAATAGCTAGDVEGKLQHRWKIASKKLDAARKQR